MRKLRFLKLLAIPLLALLLSCSKKEKDRVLTGSLPLSGESIGYGRISIAQGSNSIAAPPLTQGVLTNSNHAFSLAPDVCGSDSNWQLPYDEIQLLKFTIKSIEFSLDDQNWISLTGVPLDIEVEPSYLDRKISKINVGPFLIPAGDYKGVRIRLSPGAIVLKTKSGEPYPCELVGFPQAIISVGTYNWDNGILEEIVLDQSNDRSRISPFSIQAGKDSYLILEIYIGPSSRSQWGLWWRSVKVSDTL